MRTADWLVVLALAGAPPAPSHQPVPAATRQQATALDVGTPVEHDLGPGQTHAYGVLLAAGQFVRLSIQQRGIDVAATLAGPDGRERVSVDGSDDEVRPEVVLTIAEADGRYTLVIRPASESQPAGRYVVQIDELRAATLQDGIRVAAERAFERGETLRAPGRAAGWPEALTQFNASLDRFRQLSDRRGEMRALLGVAITQYLMSLPDALDTAQQVEAIARSLDDRVFTARVLRLIGNIYLWRGDLAAATTAFDGSSSISHELGNRNAEARSLNDAALVYNRTGDSEKAIAQYSRALVLARATGDRTLEAALLNNTGIAYKNLGDYDAALSAYQQALASRRAAQDPRGQFRALMNLGNLERLRDNPRKAQELHVEALALSRQVGAKEDEASALGTMGLDDYALGDFEQSLEHHRTALELRKQLGDLSGQALSFEGIGRALQRLGRNDEARDSLQSALTIHRSINEQFGVRDTLRDLASVERDRGNLDVALANVRASVDLDETLRSRITSPELRTSFVAAEQDKYELLIDLLQQQHLADPSGSQAAAALQVAERARARVLLDSLLDARVDLRQGISPDLLARERALQKQLNDASSQLSKALASATRKDRADAPADRLEALSADYSALQAEVRRQSPQYAALMQPQPLAGADIQRTVVDDSTILLEFALGPERSWLWVVTPATIESVALPARAEIDRAARSLYQLLTARQRRAGEKQDAYAARVADADRRLARQAADVSRMLFGGIASRLNGEWQDKRLAIVAAGALEYLPFAALPVPSAEHPTRIPLAARHEIVTLPSASVLAVLRQQSEGRRPASRTIAIVADPVFEAADPRVKSVAMQPASGSRDGSSPQVTDADARGGFTRLPFSREEASAIASLAPGKNVLEAVDFQASRSNVLSGAVADFRIVHFATHGVLDNERPSLSGLVLSLVDRSGGRQDGYLRLRDIYNMRLDADLIVLSACQTALGKEVKGEGLIGLTRAFMYAGAPRVVASLWQVSDLATAELMKHFYAGMLQRGLRPAAALRAAQLRMAEDRRWSSPYFWAGFVLEGEWR